MFKNKRFDTGDAPWGGGVVTCELFKDELGTDPRGQDIQLAVDPDGDTWSVNVLLEGATLWRVYNDNGGAGFDVNGIVLIDDVIAVGIRVILAGGNAAAPAVIVNMKQRAI